MSRSQRVQCADERLRSRILRTLARASPVREDCRSTIDPLPWDAALFPSHLPGEKVTALYVWGYGAPACRLLRDRGRSTSRARSFAVERGWNVARADAWAIEFALPVPLSRALAVLAPAIRGDPTVTGHGGSTVSPRLHGLPLGALADRPLSGERAIFLLNLLAVPRLEDSAGNTAEDDGGHAGTGMRPDLLRRTERLLERARTTVGRARTLRLCVATAVEHTRALRGQCERMETEGFGAPREKSIPWLSPAAPAAPDHPGRVPADRSGDDGTGLPNTEISVLNEVVTHAHGLAAEGSLAAGCSVLLAGRQRAEHAMVAEREWAPELVRTYALALDNHVWRYGLRLG